MAEKQPGDETAGTVALAAGRQEPMIRVAGRWIPAHQLWAKMEVASEVADSIERFNRNFPGLSTQATREVVPLVRQRLKDISIRMPRQAPSDLDSGSRLITLLAEFSPEEALQQLQEQTGEVISLHELIVLAGGDAYSQALARQALEYQANAILPEQTAQIWNEMARPAPSGGLWTASKIETLLRQG